LEYACTLAEEHNSQLTVLHVIDRANEVRSLNPGRVEKEIQERLLEVVGWRDGRLAIRYRVEFPNIPVAILRVASEIDSDLIVLGVRRSSGVLDRFMWTPC
jgi:nucleotide-binding universal stress UspA family protein